MHCEHIDLESFHESALVQAALITISLIIQPHECRRSEIIAKQAEEDSLTIVFGFLEGILYCTLNITRGNI